MRQDVLSIVCVMRKHSSQTALLARPFLLMIFRMMGLRTGATPLEEDFTLVFGQSFPLLGSDSSWVEGVLYVWF